ncbi:hypothetical protein [Methanosarcina horonobensis]|uniref:hypothetical protein n=1 Tax=Methanosarcina horonobensis TaxID=418008 RepID=UPI000A9D0B4F|nr:hypothetical protein [Methanosarcina horonobensis]
MEYTCSNCHFVCHPDKEVRKARYKMLTDSGVIIQEPDGTLKAVSPEEAKKYIESMTPERKKTVRIGSGGAICIKQNSLFIYKRK